MLDNFLRVRFEKQNDTCVLLLNGLNGPKLPFIWGLNFKTGLCLCPSMTSVFFLSSDINSFQTCCQLLRFCNGGSINPNANRSKNSSKKKFNFSHYLCFFVLNISECVNKENNKRNGITNQ